MREEPQKLVRDRIPEIIRKAGKACAVERLDDVDYRRALREKLIEEAREVAEATNEAELVAELADLSEVIDTLMETYGIDRSIVFAKQEQRSLDRGRFRQRLKLLWIES
ncbi:MAG: nucleoside triphosphate pyrophosphohydrolase [Cyanobacteria bacterium SBC]|nr:nucleoside triphosphate pyrophosphohydrolase [Cyanobacteria bacterium SBC]